MMIRNIWAVGRNYKDHAKELGNEVPAQPLIFLKAGSCASINSMDIELPEWTTEVHHEVELCLKFNNQLQISEAAVALDLTERSAQNEAKKSGLPWTLAKSFQESCPISSFLPLREFGNPQDLNLKLWVNDELKQSGNTHQMIFPIQDLVAYVLERFPVCAGDVLLTGTPAGVGPVRRGDKVKAQIEGHLTHIWQVR